MSREHDLPPERDRSLFRPENTRTLWILFIGVLILTIVPELFIERHEEFGVDGTFAFFAWFGFLSCVLLVLGARLLGFVLKREEVYYDRG